MGRGGSLFSYILFSLFLYDFEFSTLRLFLKNKGKIKTFPSNKNNKRKIIKKEERITIVHVEDDDNTESRRNSLGGAVMR